jgi:hypothetical protein
MKDIYGGSNLIVGGPSAFDPSSLVRIIGAPAAFSSAEPIQMSRSGSASGVQSAVGRCRLSAL